MVLMTASVHSRTAMLLAAASASILLTSCSTAVPPDPPGTLPPSSAQASTIQTPEQSTTTKPQSPQSSASTSTSSPSTTSGIKPSSPPTSSKGESQRKRPGWLAKVLGYSLHRTPACAQEPIRIERLSSIRLCIAGLTSADPTLRLISPSGRIDHLPAQHHDVDGGFWYWDLDAGLDDGPLRQRGTYRWSVTKPTNAAGPPPSIIQSPESSPSTESGPSEATSPPPLTSYSGVLKVVRATTATTRVTPRAGKIALAMAGLKPHTRIFVSAFGPGVSEPDGEGYPLYYDFPALSADGDGELTAHLAVPPNTPTGRYALWIDPARASGCGTAQPCWTFEVPIL